MSKTSLNLKKDLASIEKVGGRAGTDTIRLWEGFREQAIFWRALALIQIPATTLSIAAALIFYFFADTIIEVPERPQPGFYSVKQLPDSHFIDAATAVINLMSTYQPAVARRQFRTARNYLWEPALSEFEETMMGKELQAIEETKRSQMFFINTRLIKVERYPELDRVVVRIPGVRQKLIGSKSLPADEVVYYVKMTTIPRNFHNEYGIVVVGLVMRNASERELSNEDMMQERTEKQGAKKEGEGSKE